MNINKNFLFLLLIILIVGIIVFLYNKKHNELFETNLSIDDFNFNTENIYDTLYTKNTIFSQIYLSNSNTNFTDIKDFDNDGKLIKNTLFTNFLTTRSVLKDKTTNNYENFKVSSANAIEFANKNNFLEIQFTGKDNSIILKFTINSLNGTDEQINIDSNILNTGNQNINYINSGKFIKTIEFVNISMKKNNKISNMFYIKSYYNNNTGEINTFFNLPDGIDNHFCENLLNVYVYLNPLNPIKIINNFVAEIYLENLPPKIKSKKVRVTEKDLLATTFNNGMIYRVKPVGDFYPLGDYMSSDQDALLLDSKSEFVKFADNFSFVWDENYMYNSNDKDYINSIGKRKAPLILFRLRDSGKFKALGDFAYVDTKWILSSKITDLQTSYWKTYSQTFNQLTKTETIPYLLINTDCLEGMGKDATYDRERVWADHPIKGRGQVRAWAFSNTTNSSPGKLVFYTPFYESYRSSDNHYINIRTEFAQSKNFQIKQEYLISPARDPIPDDDIIKIKNDINDKLTALPTIPPPPIDTSIPAYITQINKDKTDSQLIYSTNVNFNNKMKDIQTDYNNNYSYITEINKQLSNVRQKEKAFVENQIKQQLETNKTKIQDDVKKQTEKLNKYDNDISQTSTTIGNQINEYVVLRKYRELMPDAPQIMY